MTNDVFHCVEPFLYREDDLMMNRPDMRCYFACVLQVRRALESYRVRVQPRPPRFFCLPLLYPLEPVPRCNCSYEGRVETARYEHAIRDIAHQLLFNRCLECSPQSLQRNFFRWQGARPHGIVPLDEPFPAPAVVMSRGKFLD